MKTLSDYFKTHSEPINLSYGSFSPQREMIHLHMMNGKELVTDDECELEDFYASNSKGEYRICSVCGAPFDAGYMIEDADFYACSDKCFKEDCDKRYGIGKWKRTEDLTQDERKLMANNEFGEDSYHAYLGNDGYWHPDNTFYTEWY